MTIDSEPGLATVCKSQLILPRGQVASQPTLGIGHKRSLVVTFDTGDCQSRASDAAIVSTGSCQRQLEPSARFHASSLLLRLQVTSSSPSMHSRAPTAGGGQ